MEYVKFINIDTNESFSTHDDFGYLIKSILLSPAVRKEEIVEVPGSDSYLDFSRALSNDINFQRRTLTITLNKARNQRIFFEEYAELQNCLAGQTMKIILSEDAGYFWKGVVKISEFNPYGGVTEIVIECDVEAYKYEITSSAEDWLWDPFNFEDGFINEGKDLEISGEREVVLIGRRKQMCPKITCSEKMQVEFNGNVYDLSIGTQKVLNIVIRRGENRLKFKGNGVVTIDYRGGSL